MATGNVKKVSECGDFLASKNVLRLKNRTLKTAMEAVWRQK